MAKRRKKKARGPGAVSPSKTAHPGLPPKGNVGRCVKCKRMLDVCLMEISRATPTDGVVTKRAYACREHAAEVAGEMVHVLASWTYWGRGEDEVEVSEEGLVKAVDPVGATEEDDDE